MISAAFEFRFDSARTEKSVSYGRNLVITGIGVRGFPDQNDRVVFMQKKRTDASGLAQIMNTLEQTRGHSGNGVIWGVTGTVALPLWCTS